MDFRLAPCRSEIDLKTRPLEYIKFKVLEDRNAIGDPTLTAYGYAYNVAALTSAGTWKPRLAMMMLRPCHWHLAKQIGGKYRDDRTDECRIS